MSIVARSRITRYLLILAFVDVVEGELQSLLPGR